MTNKIKFLSFGLLVLFDQASKFLVLKFLPHASTVNQGGAFSLTSGKINYIYISILSLAVFVLLVWLFDKKIQNSIGYVLILSGGISNLLDRVTYGGVVDFFSSNFWPTFNFADAFITIGAVLIALNFITRDHHPKKLKP